MVTYYNSVHHSSRQKIRVLHVDDEPEFTDLTATFLEDENNRFAVETATSADEGLKAINECQPDCIVSDYNMPGMDGLEFLAVVREDNPDLPFVLYTGKGSEAVASEAIAADVTDYIQKGSGSEQYELLANRVRNAVEARRETQRADRQEQLMRLTEFAGDTGGFETDMETGEVILTDGAKRIMDLAEDAELTIETGLEHFHPEDRAEIHRTIERAAETGEQERGTWRYQPPESDQRFLEVTFSTASTSGDATTLRGAIHDVTDCRERQRDLEQIERLFEHAHDTLFLVDVGEQFTIERINPAIEDATGVSAAEIRGQTLRELFGEQQGAAVEARYRECIERRELLEYDEKLSFSEQPTHWETKIAPVVIDGTVEYIAGSTRDVTEQKEKQRELEAQRRFIQQALDSLDDLFYVTDEDGYLRRWNDRVLEVTGYTDSELAGMQILDQFPEDERDRVRDAMETVREEGDVTLETELLSADGQPIPYEFTGGRLTDKDGNPTGLVGIGRNLVERRKQERRFQQRIEEANDIITIIDADGRYQYLSPSFERILGHDPEEKLGDTGWEYIHPEDREAVKDAFEEWITNPDGTDLVEYRFRHADGSWRWMEAQGNNQADDPAVEEFVVTSRDITDRKERQRELAQTRDLMSNMEQLADAGAWEYDPGTESLVMTDGARRITGFDTGGNITLEEAFDYVHPDDQDLLDDRFVDCLEMGEPYECEVRLTTPDGARRWVTVRGERVNDSESGDVVRGYIEDITEHKQREQEILDLKRQYQTLTENLPNGAVFLFDTDLRYVRAGGAELEAVGIPPEEIEDATPYDVFPEETADELAQYFTDSLDGNSHTFTQTLGDEIYRNRTVPVQTDDEEITYGMALSQNVTDQTERRRKLEQQNERLEEFTSVISHDLRNPLTVAEGNLELAQETCESDRLARAADAINRSQTLVDDLLTLAREGNQVNETESVALADVARSSWQTVDTGQTTLEANASRTVEADRSRLRQLFENLYRNAVEHCGDDVSVSVGTMDGGFYVADTGPGIPESDREKVFEAGYSAMQDGTGFGLRIVERIAEAHGWEITVTESEQGGARFEMTGLEFAER